MFCRSAHRPAMSTQPLSLDRSAKKLNRDDMSWFYNEFSDVVLTRTSIRPSLNQSGALDHLLTNGLSFWWSRLVSAERESCASPQENCQSTSDVSFLVGGGFPNSYSKSLNRYAEYLEVKQLTFLYLSATLVYITIGHDQVQHREGHDGMVEAAQVLDLASSREHIRL